MWFAFKPGLQIFGPFAEDVENGFQKKKRHTRNNSTKTKTPFGRRSKSRTCEASTAWGESPRKRGEEPSGVSSEKNQNQPDSVRDNSDGDRPENCDRGSRERLSSLTQGKHQKESFPVPRVWIGEEVKIRGGGPLTSRRWQSNH